MPNLEHLKNVTFNVLTSVVQEVVFILMTRISYLKAFTSIFDLSRSMSRLAFHTSPPVLQYLGL